MIHGTGSESMAFGLGKAEREGFIGSGMSGTRFRAGFVYNMGDEEASKDAAAAGKAAAQALDGRPKALLVTMDSSLACRTQLRRRRKPNAAKALYKE